MSLSKDETKNIQSKEASRAGPPRRQLGNDSKRPESIPLSPIYYVTRAIYAIKKDDALKNQYFQIVTYNYPVLQREEMLAGIQSLTELPTDLKSLRRMAMFTGSGTHFLVHNTRTAISLDDSLPSLTPDKNVLKFADRVDYASGSGDTTGTRRIEMLFGSLTIIDKNHTGIAEIREKMYDTFGLDFSKRIEISTMKRPAGRKTGENKHEIPKQAEVVPAPTSTRISSIDTKSASSASWSDEMSATSRSEVVHKVKMSMAEKEENAKVMIEQAAKRAQVEFAQLHLQNVENRCDLDMNKDYPYLSFLRDVLGARSSTASALPEDFRTETAMQGSKVIVCNKDYSPICVGTTSVVYHLLRWESGDVYVGVIFKSDIGQD